MIRDRNRQRPRGPTQFTARIAPQRCRSSGPALRTLGSRDPDLTIGATSFRPSGPATPARVTLALAARVETKTNNPFGPGRKGHSDIGPAPAARSILARSRKIAPSRHFSVRFFAQFAIGIDRGPQCAPRLRPRKPPVQSRVHPWLNSSPAQALKFGST